MNDKNKKSFQNVNQRWIISQKRTNSCQRSFWMNLYTLCLFPFFRNAALDMILLMLNFCLETKSFWKGQNLNFCKLWRKWKDICPFPHYFDTELLGKSSFDDQKLVRTPATYIRKWRSVCQPYDHYLLARTEISKDPRYIETDSETWFLLPGVVYGSSKSHFYFPSPAPFLIEKKSPHELHFH